jgi:hypothetical protein
VPARVCIGWTVRGIVSLGGRRFNFLTESIGHSWSLTILWALLSVNGMQFTFYADTDINVLESDSDTYLQIKI